MQTRIYIRCVIYNVKHPEMTGILKVICEENSVLQVANMWINIENS